MPGDPPPTPVASSLPPSDVEAAQQAHAAKMDQVQQAGAHIVQNAHLAVAAADDRAAATAQKAKAWQVLERAAGVTQQDVRKLDRESQCTSCIFIVYLLVIVGMEIDLYGFTMSWYGYWALDEGVVRALLIVAPVGYAIAVCMYVRRGQQSDDARPATTTSTAQHTARIPNRWVAEPDAPDGGEEVPELATSAAREPIKLKTYHFLPVLRYYLIIKDPVPSDIEGVFRVNSLSSFSLGVAQICCLLYWNFVAQKEMDIFVKINIASQCINWLITCVYFCLPQVCEKMKATVKINALMYNSKETLRRQYESYLATQDENSKNPTEATRRRLELFHRLVDEEISEFCRMPIDVSQFTMDEKYDMRRLIRHRMIHSFGRI